MSTSAAITPSVTSPASASDLNPRNSFDLQPSTDAMGAVISGLDLSHAVDDATFDAIEAAVDAHSVVGIRNQLLEPADFLAFAKRFGTPQINARTKDHRPGFPEITFISNVVENGEPIGSRDGGRYWHSDLCYMPKPSRVTLLNALEVPVKDGVVHGDTRFASTAAAYEALDEDMKQRLVGLRAVNSYCHHWNKKARQYGKRRVLTEEEQAQYPPAVTHSIVRTHPRTGRKGLFVCEGYTSEIVGLPQKEGQELLAFLLEHQARPEFRHHYKWQRGDLLIWDNCAVQHKATFDYAEPLWRKMQRCTLEGTAPF
ncbi:MAG: TauD/TfdA family dioxygenase [Proteobacteria bacterium]|nr:TauD/TfdA family dioxygenase [Pseudomonadota bacterium]